MNINCSTTHDYGIRYLNQIQKNHCGGKLNHVCLEGEFNPNTDPWFYSVFKNLQF